MIHESKATVFFFVCLHIPLYMDAIDNG